MPTLPRNMLNICAFLVNLKLLSNVTYIFLYWYSGFGSSPTEWPIVHNLFSPCLGLHWKELFFVGVASISVNQGDATKLCEKCHPCFISLWTIVWVNMLLKRAFHWFLLKNFRKHVHRCTKNYLFLHMGYLANQKLRIL